MTEQLFEFTNGAAAQSYLACGNFLYERLGREGAIASAAKEMNWPVHALYIHCEGHEIATLQEFLHWSGGGEGNVASVHPRCVLDPILSEKMLSLLFDEFLRCSSRPTPVRRRTANCEYQAAAGLLNIVEDKSRRRELTDEFASAVRPDGEMLSGPVISIRCGRVEGEDLRHDDPVETLCQWAPYSPMHLPTLQSSELQSGFLLPRLMLDGRQREVMAELRSRDEPRARLALRELNRLRKMPRIASQLSRQHPEWKSYVAVVQHNLDWLTGGV